MLEKILGFFAPWLPMALKALPWLGFALFFGLWMYRGQEINVAQGKTALAQAATLGAQKECQLEAQTNAAVQNAATLAQVTAAQTHTNDVLTGLNNQETVQQTSINLTDAGVTKDQTVNGNDAKSAPVLLDLSLALMKEQSK